MDTPKLVGVVFDGNAKVLSTHGGETPGEASGAAMRAWQAEQEKWTADASAEKPADGPMWDLYERTGRASPNTPPVT